MSSEFAVKDSQQPVKGRRSLRSQIIRGSVVGLLLVPTLCAATLAGGLLFGYHLVGAQGISMEPALQHGDALWTKCVDPAEVKVGDIVCLDDPIYGVITHRLTEVQPLPQEGYLLETRGDANYFPERWEVGADETIIVSLARIRYGGYVVEFLDSFGGIVLIIGLAALAIAIYVLRRHARP